MFGTQGNGNNIAILDDRMKEDKRWRIAMIECKDNIKQETLLKLLDDVTSKILDGQTRNCDYDSPSHYILNNYNLPFKRDYFRSLKHHIPSTDMKIYLSERHVSESNSNKIVSYWFRKHMGVKTYNRISIQFMRDIIFVNYLDTHMNELNDIEHMIERNTVVVNLQ